MGNAQASQRNSTETTKLTSFPHVTCTDCEKGEESEEFCECEEMLLEALFSDSEKKENEMELREICRGRRKELKTLFEIKEALSEIPNGDEISACLLELMAIEEEILDVQSWLYDEEKEDVVTHTGPTFGLKSLFPNGLITGAVHGIGGFGSSISSQLHEGRSDRDLPRLRQTIARRSQRTISMRERIEHVNRITIGCLQNQIHQLMIALTDERNHSSHLEETAAQLNEVIKILTEEVQNHQNDNANNINRLQTMNATLENANRRLTNQINQLNNVFRPIPVIIQVAGREPYEQTIHEVPRSPSP